MRKLKYIVTIALLGLSLFSGCGLIDEQLEECREDFSLVYKMRLVTNVQTELQQKLGDPRDLPLQLALEEHLRSIFSGYAHDVDLSFYSTDTIGERKEHRHAIMDAGQVTYEIELPAADYHHLALANLEQNKVVHLEDSEWRDASRLRQQSGDAINSHNTGLFSSRVPMSVHRDENQQFNVDLYMVNSACALAVNVDSCSFLSIRAEFYDLADGFFVCDSLFTYETNPAVRAEYIDATPYLEEARKRNALTTKAGEPDDSSWEEMPFLFCGVGFPSRDVSPADSDVPGQIWRCVLYVTLSDGSITRSVISVGEPLFAANLKIIRGWLHIDGSFEPGLPPEPGPPPPIDDMVCGVSITLGWHEGIHFEPEL